MQRLHVNVSVENIDQSVEFYNTLFACEPTVQKVDYAKWMLEDPRVNFAITTRGDKKGIDHVGIQAETDTEFQQMRARLEAARNPVVVQDDTECCYANSSKTWVHDPQGVAWETFLTHGEITVYGENGDLPDKNSACCTPVDTSCCTPAKA